MAKSPSREARRIETWLPIDDGRERDNPESVRRFVFDVIAGEFGKDAIPLAHAAQETIASITPSEKRAYHRVRNADWYYKATRDENHIEYGDLEVLARILDIPTALILLYTRIYSEFQSSERIKADKSLKILEAMRAAVDQAIAIVDGYRNTSDSSTSRLTYSDFAEIRRAYAEVYGELPLFGRRAKGTPSTANRRE